MSSSIATASLPGWAVQKHEDGSGTYQGNDCKDTDPTPPHTEILRIDFSPTMPTTPKRASRSQPPGSASQEHQVEDHKHQHDADVHNEPFPESMLEDEHVDADDDGHHGHEKDRHQNRLRHESTSPGLAISFLASHPSDPARD